MIYGMKEYMIRNIVFDLGNVLVDYNPSRIINAVFTEKNEQNLILNEVFLSEGWLLVDKGIISIEKHQQNLVSRFPQYAKEIEWILKHWHKDLPTNPEVFSIVQMLRDSGYDLYILSNAGHRYFEYALSNVRIFNIFTGITISAELQLVKPQREIYDQFCQIHGLKPEECLFIDDQITNVQGAMNAGWQAYQFKGTKELISYLEKTLEIHMETKEIQTS